MMEEYHFNSMKLKRKDLEDVSDDFSDFSLCSPATKIRRLDAELPSIIEDEEFDIPIIEHPVSDLGFEENVASIEGGRRGGVLIEELPNEPENIERAIVPFKPNNSPLVSSPSNFSVTVDPQLLSGIKNQILWPNHTNLVKQAEDEAREKELNSRASKECMAVIPWSPSQLPFTPQTEAPQEPQETEVYDMMESDDMEIETMDVEDNNFMSVSNQNTGPVHQWQQHCLIPQSPENMATPSPVFWYQ